MGIQVSRAHELMNEALNYRAARQDMIASNIANADTPFYRPRDISFEDYLADKRREVFADDTAQLQLATTDGAHMQPQQSAASKHPVTFFRDGHGARNDGNSVDIDVETTEMAKNAIMFNALLAAKKKGTAIYKSVIEASGKTS